MNYLVVENKEAGENVKKLLGSAGIPDVEVIVGTKELIKSIGGGYRTEQSGWPRRKAFARAVLWQF